MISSLILRLAMNPDRVEERFTHRDRVVALQHKQIIGEYKSHGCIEIFSLTFKCYMEDRGIILFPITKYLSGRRRPTQRIDNFIWINVVWWHKRRKWILFDKLYLEKKIAYKLQKLTGRNNILVLFKGLDDINKPKEAIFKLIKLDTKESFYTTAESFFPFVEYGQTTIPENFWDIVPRADEATVKKCERWKHSKKYLAKRKFFVELDLEREDYNERRRERVKDYFGNKNARTTD